MILYACSSNPGKLAEFELAARYGGLADLRIEPLPGLSRIRAPEEHGSTFEENATAKAICYSRFSDELVFADDSGLTVPALNGAPGVHSARYAGANASDEANNTLLLERLGVDNSRAAAFVCVIALAQRGAIVRTFRGIVDGEILHAPRGEKGFGYDPLFFYPPLGRSFAELTPEEKFAVSHRGTAVRTLLESIAQPVG